MCICLLEITKLQCQLFRLQLRVPPALNLPTVSLEEVFSDTTKPEQGFPHPTKINKDLGTAVNPGRRNKPGQFSPLGARSSVPLPLQAPQLATFLHSLKICRRHSVAGIRTVSLIPFAQIFKTFLCIFRLHSPADTKGTAGTAYKSRSGSISLAATS